MKYISKILRQNIVLLLCFFAIISSAQNPFIRNKGQFPKPVKAKVNLPSGSLFIEDGKLTYSFYSGEQLAQIHDLEREEKSVDAHAYSVEFVGKSKPVLVELYDESKYYENYFLGDKSTWTTNVKSFKSLCQRNVYNGINLNFYVKNDQLKYDIVVEKNANPEKIKLLYKGMDKIRLVKGNVYITTSVNTTIEYSPYAYQIINNQEVEVFCNYKLKKDVLSFEFPFGFNKNYELIIDPVLEFSTYSGSTTDNFGYTATYDNYGFLYAGSTSFGTGYPTTIGAYQINYANTSGGTDVAITKYDSTGTSRIYSTYLGGSKDELPHSMIVNSLDELFIFGTTASNDFPTTSNSFQPNFNGGSSFAPSGIGVSFPNGSDLFVSRLSANGGTLLSSTYIGGTGNDGLNTATSLKYNYADEVRGEIDIDKNNNIYIATCTQSTDFPTSNSFQNNSNGGQEGVIVKMDNQLASIIWSSYLGGNKDDAIYSLALDIDDNIYVTGGTNSVDFPTTSGAYLTTYQDSLKADAFITLINSNGSQIISSSYYGTDEYDQAYFVEIGSTNSVYLFGQTKTIGTNLVSNATYFESGASQFIAVFDEYLSSVLRSTVVGTGKGTPDISPTAFLVDVCDKIYIAGWGSNLGGPLSTLNLPIDTNAFQQTTDGNDFYLMVIDDAMSSMMYATYFGGSQSNEHVDGGTSRFDKKGIIYQSVCAGCGGNSDFPIEPNPGAVSPANNSSNCNNGVFKFNFDFPIVVADFSAPWVGCSTGISFQNLTTSSSTVNYLWYFGDGTTSTLVNPNHNYSQNGFYEVTLIATDASACNLSDTITKEIYILSNASDTIQSLVKCENDLIQIGVIPVNDPTLTYSWTPSIDLTSTSISNPFCDVNSDTQYQLIISNGSCSDTLLQNISITNLQVDAGEDTIFCISPVDLLATYSSNVTLVEWSNSPTFSSILSSTSLLNVASIGLYYVKVTDGNCEQVDSVLVSADNNLQLIAGTISAFCNDSTQIYATFSSDVNSIVWSSNNNFTDTLGHDDSLIVYAPGTYYILVKNGVCEQIDSVIVNSESIDINLITNDICKGDSVIIEVENNTPPLPITSYSWNGFIETSALLLDTPDSSRWYSVDVVNSNSCTATDSIFVNVYPYPIIDSIWTADSIVFDGDEVEVTVFTDDSVYVFMVNPTLTGWKPFQLINQFGCLVIDSVWVTIEEVFCVDKNIKIPTAFSPNNDGVNDKYFINDIDGIIIDFKLEIFNRLGQKVYFSNDQKTNEWDGTFHNEKLPPQVFDFYLEISCIGAKTLFYKGNITLVR